MCASWLCSRKEVGIPSYTLVLKQQTIDTSRVKKSNNSKCFQSSLELTRPRTARSTALKIKDYPTTTKESYELDADGQHNMFNMSVDYHTTKHELIKKKNIDVHKILHDMNDFTCKPKVLTANTIKKEDPSWGMQRSTIRDMRELTEEKGYYRHLSLFLEGTITSNHQPNCQSVVSHPMNQNKLVAESTIDKQDYISYRHKESTTGQSYYTFDFKSPQKELKVNKVVLGRGIKDAMKSRRLHINMNNKPSKVISNNTKGKHS